MKSPKYSSVTRLIVGLSVCIPFLTYSHVKAAMELDQEFVPSEPSTYGFIDDTFWRAQTFTVGKKGRLDQIQIDAAGPTSGDPLLWELHKTSSGIPNEDLLANGVVPANSSPLNFGEFIAIDTSSFGVSVSPGDVLAIVLRMEFPADGNYYLWQGQIGDPYLGGAAYLRIPGSPGYDAWQQDGMDYGFKTFVTPVPEPSTYLAGLCCLGILGSCAWRKHS